MGNWKAEGQILFKKHSLHLGNGALQIARPCSINKYVNGNQYSLGITRIKSCSTFSGLLLSEKPNRLDKRKTWVSTAMPSTILNALPSTTFPVFLATPASVISSAIVFGTSPLYFSRISLAVALTF